MAAGTVFGCVQLLIGLGIAWRRTARLALGASVLWALAWAAGWPGALYATDNGADTVDMVTGQFTPGTVFEAVTPCDANGAPATCPGPGYPPNYLGMQNPWTGHITRVPVSGPAMHPQGMIFVP